MIDFELHPEKTVRGIDPDTLIRIHKASGDSEGADPSVLVTTEGTFVVTDSIRTITARLGDAVAMSDYLDPSTERSAWFALRWVAALTKPNEDSRDGDPTLVHLSTGEALLADASIRTLSARLKLNAGIEAVEVDLEGTERPAAIVPAHVASVLRLSGPQVKEDGATCVVVLAGGTTLACRDDPDRLKELVGSAKPGIKDVEAPSIAPGR